LLLLYCRGVPWVVEVRILQDLVQRFLFPDDECPLKLYSFLPQVLLGLSGHVVGELGKVYCGADADHAHQALALLFSKGVVAPEIGEAEHDIEIH
jgi:hypothetical protein